MRAINAREFPTGNHGLGERVQRLPHQTFSAIEFRKLVGDATPGRTHEATRLPDVLNFGSYSAVSSFPVSIEKQSELVRRMVLLGVNESDIEEKFVRSGGHGGQNVNKTATCVMLLHRPTGLQVKCQTTRKQGMNRFLARETLLNKIEARTRRAAELKRAEREQAKRRNRKRSKNAKEKILADKKSRALKKERRKPVRSE